MKTTEREGIVRRLRSIEAYVNMGALQFAAASKITADSKRETIKAIDYVMEELRQLKELLQ